MLELSKDCCYCKTGHFAFKVKGLWKQKVKDFLEEFLCRHAWAREKVKEVEKIETDEAEEQKKEKSVDACRSSDNNIHCVRLESENCLIVALKNTPLKVGWTPFYMQFIIIIYFRPTITTKKTTKDE